MNNAGVGHSGGVLDSTIDDWEWVVGVNLWGVVHGCHFFVPRRWSQRGQGGHVVNVASGFGLVAGAGVAPYCTTKFAVVGLSASLRAELAPHRIGVSAVGPGVLDTDNVARGRFADETQREGAVKTFRKRGHPPERVALAVLRAIRRDVAVVPVGPEAVGGLAEPQAVRTRRPHRPRRERASNADGQERGLAPNEHQRPNHRPLGTDARQGAAGSDGTASCDTAPLAPRPDKAPSRS